MIDKTQFRFSNPAFYSVMVSDEMDTHTMDQIRNYVMGKPKFFSDKTGYSVSGLFKDQASLSGLLNTLYNLHYTILSIQRIGSEIIEFSEDNFK